MKQYTVVGYYEDTTQQFVIHVIAKNETEAVKKAPKAVNGDPQNMILVSVFYGYLSDLNECPSLSNISDWPDA